MTTKHFSTNNFDLIRLFAAAQVAVSHTIEVLAPSWNDFYMIQLWRLFPGVPIFFFVSGYLISRSYENSKSLGDYSFNRAIRIFPALHTCVIFNLLIVALTGYLVAVEVGLLDVFLLYLGKATILQFYNPDFMRGFGDGVLNGSLWTITVELQFYFLTPIIYWAFIRQHHRLRSDSMLIALLLTSLAINRGIYYFIGDYGDTIIWKLIRVSFAPWFYMFLFGVLCQRHYRTISHYLNPRIAVGFLMVYTGYAWSLRSAGEPLNNAVGPMLFFPLAIAMLAIAYTRPDLAQRLLHRNDISYGLYIYHMPIVNQLHHLGVFGPLAVVGTLGVSVVLALVSWFGLERPLLKRKRSTLNPMSSTKHYAGATAAKAENIS